MTRRDYLILSFLTLLLCLFLILQGADPAYTDAYYYYNAGEKLAHGDGLTDAYLWVYVNAPEHLPAESHRYWMPLTSILAALPMFIFGINFNVAQWAFIPWVILLAHQGMWLGWRIGGSRRHAWVAGLCVPLGGLYLPFWLAVDSFELFGAVGCGALIALGLGREKQDYRWFALAGLLAGLAHLTRADGLLLLIVAVMVVLWKNPPVLRWQGLAALLGAYLLIMLPWFIRNSTAFGAPLPSGGVGAIFLRDYNDLFSYPAAWSAQDFWDWGLANILRSRWEGALAAFQTWLVIEGLVILAPFGLWALWQRRRDPFWMGVIWYAVGLHLAMALVFTYPGIRGGLFHSATALYPFWIALGLVGLDQGVAKLGKWRRWRIKQAQAVFGSAVLLLPLTIGLFALNRQNAVRGSEPDYQAYTAGLPSDARLMVNDPAAWYYHTGRMGVTLPDESLETAHKIAEKYCITHLIIDQNVTRAFELLLRGEAPPPFLTEIRHDDGDTPEDWKDDVRIYAFATTCR